MGTPVWVGVTMSVSHTSWTTQASPTPAFMGWVQGRRGSSEELSSQLFMPRFQLMQPGLSEAGS